MNTTFRVRPQRFKSRLHRVQTLRCGDSLGSSKPQFPHLWCEENNVCKALSVMSGPPGKIQDVHYYH